MTKAKRVEKLKHFITCLKCEVSGKCCDNNCPTQYNAGNMGEIIENLEEIAKALEQEPTTKNDLGVDCISRKAILDELEKWDWQELYLPIHFKENIVDVLPSVTPQEPILDKIRAEIEKLQKMCDKNDLNLMAQHHAFGMALDVIDKYKAESEGKE